MQSIAKSVDEYISTFPKDIQTKLEKIRTIVRRLAPDATEKISYGIPTFYYNGNLVHYAAFKNHISFYPGGEVVEKFSDELKKYKTSKGTIQFQLEDEIPTKLIEDIVKFRVKEDSKGGESV